MTSTPAPSRPPRPWLAALLSLVVPGVGQLYTWHPWSALACWLGAQVAGMIVAALLLDVPGALGMAVALALFVVIHVAIVVHAWLLARWPDAATARRPERPVLATLLVAAIAVSWTIGRAEGSAVERTGMRAFRIPSGGMMPGIAIGDMILVRPRPASDALRRDEIVAYRRDVYDMMQRVVGLGGDTLAMRGGRLVRNGRAVAEPYARTDRDTVKASDDFRWQRAYLVAGIDTTAYRPTVDTWGPLVVPRDSIFVLGDNRHNSLDSRYVGFVAADRVFGRPTRVYFSYDRERHVARWDRIGHEVR